MHFDRTGSGSGSVSGFGSSRMLKVHGYKSRHEHGLWKAVMHKATRDSQLRRNSVALMTHGGGLSKSETDQSDCIPRRCNSDESVRSVSKPSQSFLANAMAINPVAAVHGLMAAKYMIIMRK